MAFEDKIVAEVQGKNIMLSQVVQTIAEMGESGKTLRSEEGMKQVSEELLNQELLYLDAKKNHLDEEEPYLLALEQMKADLLKQYAMQKLLSEVTLEEDELREYYDSHQDQYKDLKMHASHILVETEEKAKEILQEIEGGLEFTEAAKKHSSCPSASSGGDLGVFGPGQMVGPFDEAAQEAEVGKVVGPVKTQFGAHLILVHERDEKPSTFEEVQDQIRQKYGLMKQQEAYLQKMHVLNEEYEPKIYY